MSTLPPSADAAEKSRNYVRLHWKYTEPGPLSPDGCGDSGSSCHPDGFTDFIDRIQSHSLCISGMAFQDAWNLDLDRLQRCCVHVATPQKTLVPFCAYYLTDSKGRKLIDQDPCNLLK
ncbi:MAG: hypothetical protein QUT30_06520 [Acidobacteriota bacterium]|nr:hypothetical protein [Acidobacteriota bacterium]